MLTTELPVHMRLMLAAACAGAGIEVDLEPLLQQPFTWPSFLAVCATHRLAPLVLEGFERRRMVLPAEVSAALAQTRRNNALNAIRTSLEASRVASHFARAGFSLSVLKGVPLSQIAYGDPARRHVGDLDLLTQPLELERQIALLAELGYEVTNPASRLTPRRLKSFVAHWKDLTVEHVETGLTLELHWRLFNNRHHPANLLVRQQPVEVPVYNYKVLALPALEQFLYVAVHGASDEWIYLKALVDIAAFLHALSPKDLRAALDRARLLGLLAQVSSAIHLACEWLPISEVAAPILPASDAFHQRTRAAVLRRLRLSDFNPERTALPALSAAALELRLVPGWPTAAAIASRFLFRPRIWRTYDLPDSQFWLYPILGLLTPARSHGTLDRAGD